MTIRNLFTTIMVVAGMFAAGVGGLIWLATQGR